MNDPTELREEALRLSRLSADQLRTEITHCGLRLGEASRQADEDLERLDRELLAALAREPAAD